jgi:hypothetical protein
MISLKQLLIYLGGEGVVLTVIFYFLLNRIAEKLSIRWKETSDINIAKIQSELSKNNATFNSILSLSAANYHQAQERRIKAIEILWQNLLEYKNIIPPEGQFIYNILGENEIENFWIRETDNKHFNALRDKLAGLDVNTHINRYLLVLASIKSERAFIGEKIWDAYFVYQQFIGRIAVLLLIEKKKEGFIHWNKDDLMNEILESYLSKNEIEYLYSSTYNSLKVTSEFLENKLLIEINKVLSGESFSETALERIKRLTPIFNKEPV